MGQAGEHGALEEYSRLQQLHLNTLSEVHEVKALLENIAGLSQHLYAAAGRLLVDFLPTGFKFGVDIERQGSDGIDNMTIFCFDLMLAQLGSDRSRTPGFLWHDSRVFECDPRQRASQLHHGSA